MKKCTPWGAFLFAHGDTIHAKEKALKKELEILIKLQAVDLELYQAERFHREHPEKVKKLDKRIEDEKGRVKQAQERLESLQKDKRQKEKDLEADMERVKKSEEKLAAVKTNKEYQSALKEIEAFKQMSSEKEDAILLAMEEIDTIQAELKHRERELQIKLKEYEEAKNRLEEEDKKYGAVGEEKHVLREELARELELSLQRQYQKIKEKRNGLAVVMVKDGTCSGCSMHIPPQVINEVLTNEHIITCPSCNRIIYVKKEGNTVDNHQSKADTIGTQGV
jgi:predicted  nucleic acid-binding Zn-ribbon protein